MTKRTKALVRGALLSWARTSAGYGLAEAAEKLGVDQEQLEAWEAEGDESAPSIPQLRKAANLYKRPLAVFYLAEPPLAFQPMSDFRRLPESGSRTFSPDLTLEIRRAHQRRELALEMLAEADERPPAFVLSAKLTDSTEALGDAVRGALGVTRPLQAAWRDDLAAFRAWRTRIEALGVLVFEASRIESGEASGFAFWAEVLPFMVVNGKDTHSRRTFSLLHELVHLMLHQSGVSDLDAEGGRSGDAERIEVFCNQVAADALLPRSDFLAEPIVTAKGAGRHEWSDEAIKALATAYSVSRETVVRRLLTLGRTTEDFYGRKRTQYQREFMAQRQRTKELNEGKPIPRNMPRETLATFGRPFVRLVMENYRADRLSLAEVSGYLGVKVKHLPEIEQQARPT